MSEDDQIKILEQMESIMAYMNEKLKMDLDLHWMPNHIKYFDNGNLLNGEVIDKSIYIYDDGEEAIETLKHEYIDHAVSTIESVNKNMLELIFELSTLDNKMEEKVEMLNLILKTFDWVRYYQKEKVVDKLCSLISFSDHDLTTG